MQQKKWYHWYKKWPFWITFAIIPLNMEVVIVPFLTNVVGLRGLYLFLSVCICTTIEISYWYWFTGWLYSWMKQISTVQEVIQLGRDEIIPKAEQSSIPATIHLWVKHHIIDQFNQDIHKRKRIFKIIKGLGYVGGCLALFAVGAAPFFWITGLILCKSVKWKIGFSCLIGGNIVKNYGLGSIFSELWLFIWNFTVEF